MKTFRKINLAVLALALVSTSTLAGWRDTKTSNDTLEAADYNRLIDASWNELSGDIWRASGAVGIGTTAPSSALDIVGDLEVGATDFFVDDSAGRVGIGTTSPSYTLDVVGTVNATTFSIGGTAITATAAELNYVDGVTSAIQTQLDAKSLAASPTFTGDVTMPGTGIWNSSGNVGIGTTSPSSKLSIVTGAIGTTGITFEGTTYKTYLKDQNGALGVSSNYPGTTAIFRLLPYLDQIWFQNTVSSGDIYFSGNNGDNLTGDIVFKISGNVGIGTTSPQRKLSVATTGDNYGINLGDAGNATGKHLSLGYFLTADYGRIDSYDFNTSAYKDLFFNGGDITLKADGKVGIGTTAPTQKLHVEGGSSAVMAVLEDDFITNRYQFTTGGNDLESFFNVTGDSSRAAHVRSISGSLSVDLTAGFGRNDVSYSGASLNLRSGGANNFTLTTGGDATLLGKLVVSGSGNTTIAGSVGIGTTAPAVKLDVDGIIKTAPRSSATCDTNSEGGVYYDSDDNHFYGCNGSSWVQLDN